MGDGGAGVQEGPLTDYDTMIVSNHDDDSSRGSKSTKEASYLLKNLA